MVRGGLPGGLSHSDKRHDPEDGPQIPKLSQWLRSLNAYGLSRAEGSKKRMTGADGIRTGHLCQRLKLQGVNLPGPIIGMAV
jgi:hypothetical protein